MLPVSFIFITINNPKFGQPFAILIPSRQEVSHCQITMSKSKLRQEDNCLNCGQKVHTRFCSHCGQENKEPYETFWGLLFHFIEDIFHYDGKLFSTIRVLFTKPGYLSAEYLSGKRTTYLHPIRFYLFTSAFFFICLFYVFHPLESYLEKPEANSKKELSVPAISFKNGLIVDEKANPKTYTDYLKDQSKLPVAKRDSEWEQKLVKQAYSVGEEYGNSEELVKALADILLHKLSTILFIALPLLAFILQLVFIRRKGFYYMHHGIFVLHVATSLFLVLWLTNVVDLTALASHQNWLHVVSSVLVWAWIVYYFVSFKRFYRLSSGKAVAYFLTSTFLQNIVLLIIFLGLLVFSFFSL
jgi:hypothetical protein